MGRQFILTGFLFILLLADSSHAEQRCACKKEVVGRQLLLTDTLPSTAVDSKRGYYFLVQSAVNLNGTIRDSTGSQLARIIISAEPARSSYTFDFSVAYDPIKDQYLVAWIAPDPTGAFHFPIRGQFVDAATGHLRGSPIEIRTGLFERVKLIYNNGVKLIYNKINKQYILGYETISGNNNKPTFLFQRLASNGHLIGTQVNLGIHAEDVSMQQDTIKNRFLIAWEGRYLFFQVVNSKLEPVAAKKKVIEGIDPHVLYSLKRKSFVLFWIAPSDRARIYSQLIDANGEFASKMIPLFSASKIFDVKVNAATHGFLIFYPLYNLHLARIDDDFSVEEKGILLECEHLYSASGYLISNNISSEFAAIWSGRTQQFDGTSKTLFQRIRRVQTGACQ
jgi:hypothetical protein